MSDPRLSVEDHFPRLGNLLKRGQIERRRQEFDRLGVGPLYQVERDLILLERHVPARELGRAYRDLLNNAGNFVQALYEIRVAAMLASAANGLVLAPPSGEGRADLECVIGDQRVFVEVTTYLDRWPPPDGQMDSRATVERSFDSTDRPTEPNHRDVPASKEIRDRVIGEIRQLPEGEPSLIVLGAPNTWSGDVEDALLGDADGLCSRSSFSVSRTANGLFCVPDEIGGASRLSALVWLKLSPSFLDVRVASRLFVNPRARAPLSAAAGRVLRDLFDRGAILREELQRITPILIEKYCPERIILFGSLADELVNHHDRVHQWSDIDLAIVKRTSRKFTDRIGDVLRLVEPRVGLNVLIYTPDEFESAERSGSFFVRDEIVKQGVVLYP